jgi:hypothetical protein
MKKASELLKGTEDLKRQLEELSSLATWNDDGNLIIRPPTPPAAPSNLNRSVSDKVRRMGKREAKTTFRKEVQLNPTNLRST